MSPSFRLPLEPVTSSSPHLQSQRKVLDQFDKSGQGEYVSSVQVFANEEDSHTSSVSERVEMRRAHSDAKSEEGKR
jgi:hypothetical protein